MKRITPDFTRMVSLKSGKTKEEMKAEMLGFKVTQGNWYVHTYTRNEVYVEGGLRVAEVWAASRRVWLDMSNPKKT